MKFKTHFLHLAALLTLLSAPTALIADTIVIPGESGGGISQPPVPVSISGFTGEAAEVIHFDLFVQGFTNVGPDAAQYLLSGSNNGNLTGRASDRFNKASLVNKSYTGGTLRRQAHTFVDD